MKKLKLLLTLSFLILTNTFAQEDNLKSNQETEINISLEEDKYLKYKEDEYSAPPKFEQNKKPKKEDLEIGGNIEVDKETKVLDKLEVDVNKKF